LERHCLLEELNGLFASAEVGIGETQGTGASQRVWVTRTQVLGIKRACGLELLGRNFVFAQVCKGDSQCYPQASFDQWLVCEVIANRRQYGLDRLAEADVAAQSAFESLGPGGSEDLV